MNDDDRHPLNDLLLPSPALFVISGVLVIGGLALLVLLGWI